MKGVVRILARARPAADRRVIVPLYLVIGVDRDCVRLDGDVVIPDCLVYRLSERRVDRRLVLDRWWLFRGIGVYRSIVIECDCVFEVGILYDETQLR